MGITTYPWATQLQHEALKCWFYGISFSILLGYYQILTAYPQSKKATPTRKIDEKNAEVAIEKDASSAAVKFTKKGAELEKLAEDRRARARTYTQLAIDHCDIFLPGSAVGWIPVGSVMVGTCQSISSLLAMGQVWERVSKAG